MDENNQEIQIVKVPIEVFIQIAPKMIEHLVHTMYRVIEIAQVQKNVAILEVASESSKYVENLMLSYIDAMKDMQDEQENNPEGA